MVGQLVTLVAVLVLGAMPMTGCDGNEPAPTTLMNGSRAPELSIDLEGIESGIVLTSVAAGRRSEIDASAIVATCLERAGGDHVSGPIVVRIGVDGESVTVRTRSTRGLYGCDNSQGPREADRRVCGVAFGQLAENRLRDPRLDLGACTTKDGAALGFAWVEPSPRTRYVAVEQDAYVEVYQTAGQLPVRVTTSDVEVEQSSATFRVSEHGSDGGLIRRYRLEPSVAG
ncbi:MAG: hypothetical protein ACRDPV_10685 [Gaiellaceae bacterium]